VGLRFFKTCGLLVFGLVLIKICLFFWACFLQISVLRIVFLSNFMTIFLFQFAAKRNLGVFLCECAHFCFFFGYDSLLHLTNLLVLFFLLIFLPNARWACFSFKLPISGLFFIFACFYKLTWHHC